MSLVQMSLSAALMIVAIIILRALTIERFPKKTFLVLWWIALLRLLIPFSIPSVMSFYSWFDPNLPAVVEQSSAVESTFEPVLDDSSETMENSTQFEMTPIPDTDIEYVEVKPSKSFSESFFDMLPVIWGIGIGVIAAFFGINYWKGVREFRMSLPVENEFVNEWLSSHQLRRNITIRQYDCIHTPLTYGIFRPVILLPKESLEQSPSTLNFILTHEWVHIRRFDCVTKILLTAALCIHWMNPLVWVMYLLFNRDIELSCDETVLHLLGRNRRSDYALALINMEEQKGGFASFASGFGRNAIEERIRAIMKMKKASLITILAAVVVVACVSILFATSAKNNPTESPSASEESSSNPVMKGTDGVYREINLEDYKQYESYGMTYNKEKNLFYYENKPVRFFYDSGSGNSFTDYYEGEVDVEATRDKDNKLTGLHYSSQEDSERRTKEIEQMDSSVTASENSDTIYSPLPSSGFSKDDKTSENVLASYQKYGISYNKDNDTWFYQNKPVRALLDRYNGNTFFSGNGEINLKAIYDDNGNFQKIEVLTDKQMEQELSSNSVKKILP
jgi:bla regulator protein BlaR1